MQGEGCRDGELETAVNWRGFFVPRGNLVICTLSRILLLEDKIIEVESGSTKFTPVLLLKLGRNLMRVDSTASLLLFLFDWYTILDSGQLIE